MIVPQRLILFDIDGTLLSAGGAPRRAFRTALVEHFGTEGAAGSGDFSGKTDPQIVYELMRAVGFGDGAIELKMADFFDHYLAELERELAVETRHRLYPGVAQLIPALARDPRVAVGLLTGNIEAGARLKLAHFGLWDYFQVGAFGSDDRTRDRLGPVAIARAEIRFGRRFEESDVAVVGDTPADVQCARAVGAIAIAVCTGTPSRAALEACAPDLLLDSLADWPESLFPGENGLRNRRSAARGRVEEAWSRSAS